MFRATDSTSIHPSMVQLTSVWWSILQRGYGIESSARASGPVFPLETWCVRFWLGTYTSLRSEGV
jgi:hypothetical protein